MVELNYTFNNLSVNALNKIRARQTGRLTLNQSVVSSSPIKHFYCFLEPATLHNFLSTGWLQE